jgi:redox-sensitive bicupin YhaK (pirin superfamily)
MITIRKSEDRGHADHGWLNTFHSFSFANYYDPNHMGFSVLRVINEDWIDAGTGFGTHPHQDMEIITYVVEGALYHKDSMGNETTIKPGEVQRMSAGTGIRHSEHNYNQDGKTHLFQIWILPEQKGITPSYDQKSFSKALTENEFILVASRNGRENSVSLNQDVDMYLMKAHGSNELTFDNTQKRNIWIQVITGTLNVNNIKAASGDGISISQMNPIILKWNADTEFILFDLP